MNIIYCITKFNFFSSHKGGQVAHAQGIINGLINNNINCKYLGPENIYFKNDFFNANINHIKFKFRIYSLIFSLVKNNKQILIRKNIENIIILYLFSFFLSKKQRELQ